MKKNYTALFVTACFLLSLSFTALTYAQSFNASGLNGENLNNPTSLGFGPNGKLYVSQQNATIFEFTVLRDNAEPGMGTYTAINSSSINLVRTDTPNHNDDGTINTLKKRQVTGLLATGTPANPVLYISSSDSRIGGGGSGNDINLDTNSGVLSRLTWSGSEWNKVDLVRGLPRCEENHSTNGMEIFERNGSSYLLLQQGGNTNKGAPASNFAGTSETSLSGALLIINLTQLEQIEALNGGPFVDSRQGNTYYIYDLPTLNDPERIDIDNTSPNFPYSVDHPLYNATIDLGDPFGGNNGLNQAFPEPGGPVQIFSPGWRNGYDVEITADGRIYSVDNGPNTTWGGLSVIYDNNGQRKIDQSTTGYNPNVGDYVTNEFNEEGSNGHGDPLHYVGNITDANGSYYAGHPAPIRAFPSRAGLKVYTFDGSNWASDTGYSFDTLLNGVSGYFNTSFDLSNFPDKPIQGEYLANAPNDSRMRILDIVNSSTNGICEYTASNFEGTMQGDLLTASFNGKISRYQLNINGNGINSKDSNFLTGFGSTPLDVIAQGDADPFPGTIWAATYGADNITVFEPTDFFGCIQPGDFGYVGSEDYDSDGYSNDDEVANGTDICSGGSQPKDYDGDFISDLNDPDDDNDGIPDIQDAFVLDADNGTTTNLPINYSFWNNDPGTGFFGLGFTGLMLDPSGNTDYLDQYDEKNLSFGGAGGKATIDAVSPGNAYQSVNSQDNAFQFGVNLSNNSKPFTVHTKITTPFANVSSVADLSYGIYIGNGDQDHYFKVVVDDGLTENDGLYGFEVLKEDGAAEVFSQKYNVTGLKDAISVEIYINVNPSANTAQPYYSIDGGENVIQLGNAVVLPIELLRADDSQGLAVGLISTSGTGEAFTATWDFLKVIENGDANLVLSENLVDFGLLETGSGQVQLISTLTNQGGPSAGAIEITAINRTGTDGILFGHSLELPLVIGPGTNKTLPLNFFPNNSLGLKTANLQIVHSGANSPFVVPMTAILEETNEPTYAIVARINVGGSSVAAVDGNIDWESNLGNGAVSGINYSVNTGAIPGWTNTFLYENRHSSVSDYIDEGTFYALYGKERYDATTGPEMEFKFPVPNGDYLVNIYTGNGYGPVNSVGERLFDVSLETELKGDDIDVVALFGGIGSVFHAGMLSYTATVDDGELNVLFEHTGIENPVLQAIEVMVSTSGNDPITIAPIVNQFNVVGDQSTLAVSVSGGNPEENFTYAISGQPEGIDIEPTNGQIFGTLSTNANTGGLNNDGVHNVNITVSKPGSNTEIISFIWTVNNIGSPVAIAIATPLEGQAPLEVDFTGSSSTDDNDTDLQYQWNFGDGLGSSTDADTSYTFTSAGEYVVSLTVTDSDNLFDTAITTITVLSPPNTAPNAVAAITPLNGSNSLRFGFDASSSNDIQGAINYLWNFGDGNTSTDAITNHSYSAAGTYEVTLTVTDEGNLMDTKTLSVIAKDPITGDFALRINAGGPQLTHDGKVFSADQNFIGGKPYANARASVPQLYKTERTASPPTFAYDIPLPEGNYQVVLHFAEIYWGATGGGAVGTEKRVFDVTMEGIKVLDDYDINADVGPQTAVLKTSNITITDGILNLVFDAVGSDGVDQPKLSAIEILSAGVTSEGPVAIATATSLTGTVPFNVSFDGSGSTSDGAVVSYDWDFKDGNTKTGSLVDHTFATAGTYEVLLTVTDGEDETATDIVTITVTSANVGPTAVAVATTLSGEVPLEVRFDGTGSYDTDGGIVSYEWNFADGTPVVTGAEVDHTFATAGTYEVLLTVTDGEDETATDIVTITVEVPVISDFVLRINAGGPQLTHDGKVFSADQNFIGGKPYANARASVPQLYKTERTAFPPTFAYDIPLPDGNYQVVLHFAEIYWGATGGGAVGTGKRVFDVVMEGNTVMNDYDIIADVGPQTVVTKTFDVVITDGALNLGFDAEGSDGGDQPKLSAIEVFGFGTNKVDPIANAGEDIEVALPTNGFTLSGSGIDPDGGTVTYEWSQSSGPESALLINSNMPESTVVVLVEGVYVFRLTVTDDEGKKILDEVNVTAIDSSNSDEVWLEAECAVVGSNWTVMNSGSASGGQYLLSPSGNNFNAAPSDVASRVSFGFSAKSGSYKLFARVDTPTGNNDSFWVRANGGPWLEWNYILGGGFNWRQLHDKARRTVYVTLNLVEGINTVEFAHREQGAGLDKIYLTKTGSIPSGLGGPTSNCGGSGKSSRDDLATYNFNNDVNSKPDKGAEKVPNTVSLFPNPASVSVSLGFGKAVNLETISIYDMSGKMVLAVNAKHTSKRRNYELNVIDLPSGLYIVISKDTNGNEINKRLLIQQ